MDMLPLFALLILAIGALYWKLSRPDPMTDDDRATMDDLRRYLED